MSEIKDVTPAAQTPEPAALTPEQKTWNEYMLICAKVGQLYLASQENEVMLNNAVVDLRNAIDKHNKQVKKTSPTPQQPQTPAQTEAH